MEKAQWLDALRAAAVCETAWLNRDGSVDAEPGVPLLWRERPALAFTYARKAHARRLAEAETLALALTDRRLSAGGWRPTSLHGRPRLIEDPEGETFGAELLQQELRKFPPARALADSPLLRREHWWYLPRLIVVLDATTTEESAARGTAQPLAAVGTGGRLHLSPADFDGRRVDATHAPLPDGPAALLQHDFSTPDAERRARRKHLGRLSSGRFEGRTVVDEYPLPPAPGLLRRLRRQHRLSRDCRRALAAVES